MPLSPRQKEKLNAIGDAMALFNSIPPEDRFRFIGIIIGLLTFINEAEISD